MKVLISLFVIITLMNYVYSQEIEITEPYDIKEYFLLVPYEILEIKQEDRLKTLESTSYKKASELNSYYMLEIMDIKNGYMKFLTISDGGGDIYEITYFKQKNGERIIAINFITWAMCCEDSDVKFYKIAVKNWVEITKWVLPEIYDTDFLDSNTAAELKDTLYLRFYLPQKGKDITVDVADTYFEEMNEENQDKAYKGLKNNSILLKWNDGKFIKQNIKTEK